MMVAFYSPNNRFPEKNPGAIPDSVLTAPRQNDYVDAKRKPGAKPPASVRLTAIEGRRPASL